MQRRHRNMVVLAGRLGWPRGMAGKLTEIECDFWSWTTWYYSRAERGIPVGSCVARLLEPMRDYRPRLVAASPEELAGMIAEAEDVRREKANTCPRCGQKRG